MKKLILSIAILITSSTAFSQSATDTSKTPTKSFPIPVVKMIVKDLLRGDEAIKTLELTEIQLKETERMVSLKDSIIFTMKEKENNYLMIIDAEREKFKIQEDYSKSLEKSLRKERAKNKFTKIVTGGALLGLTYLLISR